MADQPGARHARVRWRCRSCSSRCDRAPCGRRATSTSRSSLVSVLTAPLALRRPIALLLGAGARSGRQAVSRADPPGARRLPLSLHDAAGSIGHAADSGGAAARARADAVDATTLGTPLRREDDDHSRGSLQLSAGRFIAIDADGRIALTRKGVWFGRFVTAGRQLFGIASAN